MASHTSPDTVHRLIEREFDGLSPELQRAARWLRQNESALAVRSMRASARAAGVTPATMTRLAQRLGFPGFEALRAPYVERATGGTAALPRRPRAGRRGAAPEAFHRLNRLQQADVASVAGMNDARAVDAAADALLRAERVLFLGLRGSHAVAFLLHYGWALLRDNGALLGATPGTLTDEVALAGPGTALVAVSTAPYTRQTVASVTAARRQGAAVVAITDALLSPIARGADHVLLAEAASTFFLDSRAGAVALAESLLAAASARGGEPVRARLARMQQHLQASRAYWERNDRKTSMDPPR